MTAVFAGLVCASALAVPGVVQSLAVTSADARTGAEAQVGPALTWKSCRGSKRAQCAKLEVPVDWAKPRGKQISLAIARLPA